MFHEHIMVDPVLLLLLAGVITLWLGCACWSSSIAEARGYGPKLHFLIGLLLPIVYPPITLMGLNVKKSRAATKKPKEKPQDTAQVESTDQDRKKPPENEAPSPATRKQAEKSPPAEEPSTSEDTIPDAPDLILPEDQPPTSRPEKTGPGLRPLRKAHAPQDQAVAGDAADTQPREYNQALFRDMAEQAQSSGVRFRIRYAGGREVTAVEIAEASPEYAVVSVETDEGSTQRVRIPYARVEAVEPAK